MEQTVRIGVRAGGSEVTLASAQGQPTDWSADGRRLLTEVTRDILVYDMVGSLTPVAEHGGR